MQLLSTPAAIWTAIRKISRRAEDPMDDPPDRLSVYYSTYMMLIFYIVSISKLYVGEAIQCLPPKESHKSWNHFYKSYCFVQPMHVVYGNGSYQDEYFFKSMEREVFSYYPWIPYAFLLHFAAFYAPKMIWNFAMNVSGSEYKFLIRVAWETQIPSKKRQMRITHFARSMKDTFTSYPPKKSFISSMSIVFYLIKKWLYVVSPIFQFFVIKNVIADGSYFWGFEVLWKYSTLGFHRPTVSLPVKVNCRVRYSYDNMMQLRIIPCLLGMNVLFEKIYVVLYFWLIFVTFVSLYSAIRNTLFLLSHKSRVDYIKEALKYSGVSISDHIAGDFIHHALRPEGFLTYFLIRQSFSNAVSDPLLNRLLHEAYMIKPANPIHDHFAPRANKFNATTRARNNTKKPTNNRQHANGSQQWPRQRLNEQRGFSQPSQPNNANRDDSRPLLDHKKDHPRNNVQQEQVNLR